MTMCGSSYVVNLFKQKVVSQKNDLLATMTLHNNLVLKACFTLNMDWNINP